MTGLTPFIKSVYGIFPFIIILSMTSCSQPSETPREEEGPPNIVFILADDLGYGDLSFLGQEHFETPNIDRLAKEGLFFSQMYSGSTVCAPSRSVLVTGQHTGHTFIRGNREVKPEGQYPLADSITTLFEFFKDQGYATGAFGKWGLGYPGSEGDPVNQGVDKFYGFNCQRIGHNYYPYYLWDNQQQVDLPQNQGRGEGDYAPYYIQNQALQFIKDHRDQPFFMFRPTIIPHAELKAPKEIMDKYKSLLVEEKTYNGTDDGPNYKLGGYGSQTHPRAAFAAMVEILDRQVGEIVDLLDSLGIRDQTMIVFSSDNGPHQEGGADPDFFNSNSIYRGYKRDLYEGGIRVPTIFNWPKKIKAGVTDQMAAFWDLYPTIMDLLGVEDSPHEMDGLSILPTLMGSAEDQEQHEHMYWEFHERGGRIALRKGDFKLVYYNVLKPEQAKIELYNIVKDPGESQDLSEEMPEMVEELLNIAKKERTSSKVFTFDATAYNG
ncbi:arylsulfatase [Membranihabitans marinus]|uniref:arylsulfatase n=1 Tax=Membranihabitans marinus TaxID=1227546 RepID=UPI001F2A8C8C|nr:arylsulfatase [Membranihabitans marinus]